MISIYCPKYSTSDKERVINIYTVTLIYDCFSPTDVFNYSEYIKFVEADEGEAEKVVERLNVDKNTHS